MIIYFLGADSKPLSDTANPLYVPLNVHVPLYEPGLIAVARHHLLQLGLGLVQGLLWVQVLLVPHVHCLGHHYQHHLLVLHVKQVEYLYSVNSL